ncbi:preprotein translocase [Candidatus Roizmanbacteria bacterium RIFCSPLOWO2_02_FULL_43_10]|uniref:Preprotein translocase n=1 Tax=Candidatus Roizmanbacteria bacterium RIFCSPLOWO2_02_FULL_43_10 TaxID=1802078 RepID=A0A1F7JTZ2_9BACT|nr:MAG: preprotein translocase [Candidatus Roizmanbacteria bacterium RIFCSPLOWO2_02_FULL_43_10]
MGTSEIIIIALLVLIFFGGKRLPDFIRSLGKSVEEFKKGLKEEKKS